MDVQPRKELVGLPKTVHGGQAWRLTGVEDFSQNLNPMGPPPGLADELRKAYAAVGHYPDADCTECREVVARRHGVERDSVVMGSGSSEVIRNFANAFLGPGDSVLMARPTFAEYGQQCRIAGAQVDTFDLLQANDFRVDRDGLSDALATSHYKALWLCNPNNPTGRIESRETLEAIVSECEELGTLVFLDETLLELCRDSDSTSLIPTLDRHPNLVVARSLTKSFAIPGIRVGYGVTSPEIAAELEKVRLPWNLGALEQAAAIYLVGNAMGYVDEAAAELSKESSLFRSMLDDVGFPVGPLSDSFFYFVPVSQYGLTGEEMQRQMLKEGIMVRDCASFGSGFEGYIRYCVKDRERNARFVSAAEKVMDALGR